MGKEKMGSRADYLFYLPLVVEAHGRSLGSNAVFDIIVLFLLHTLL